MHRNKKEKHMNSRSLESNKSSWRENIQDFQGLWWEVYFCYIPKTNLGVCAWGREITNLLFFFQSSNTPLLLSNRKE